MHWRILRYPGTEMAITWRWYKNYIFYDYLRLRIFNLCLRIPSQKKNRSSKKWWITAILSGNEMDQCSFRLRTRKGQRRNLRTGLKFVLPPPTPPRRPACIQYNALPQRNHVARGFDIFPQHSRVYLWRHSPLAPTPVTAEEYSPGVQSVRPSATKGRWRLGRSKMSRSETQCRVFS